MKWTKDSIPDLKGKTAIVTGANSGTGFEVTKALSSKGAHVILACRNFVRGNIAKDRILEETPDALLEVMELDLASLASIRSFVDNFKSKKNSLHILCNNAGVMWTPDLRTKDDFEIQLGTNHLGHFALTGLLIEILHHTKGSRVITMSSNTHIVGKIDLDNLNWNPPKSYSSNGAYAQSKLANLLFTYELDRKLRATNSDTFRIKNRKCANSSICRNGCSTTVNGCSS
jgi:NAD(P)-dependent dehydrogenase (short-subunit alcohol dehydrogenase family)